MSTKLTITARPDTRYRADARPLIVEITTPDATTDVCGSGWRIGDQPIHITAQRGEFFEVGGGLSRTSRRGLLALRDAIDAALALEFQDGDHNPLADFGPVSASRPSRFVAPVEAPTTSRSWPSRRSG